MQVWGASGLGFRGSCTLTSASPGDGFTSRIFSFAISCSVLSPIAEKMATSSRHNLSFRAEFSHPIHVSSSAGDGIIRSQRNVTIRIGDKQSFQFVFIFKRSHWISMREIGRIMVVFGNSKEPEYCYTLTSLQEWFGKVLQPLAGSAEWSSAVQLPVQVQSPLIWDPTETAKNLANHLQSLRLAFWQSCPP